MKTATKLGRFDLIATFDRQRHAGAEMPVDVGRITERRTEHSFSEIIVTIESGIAKGWTGFARMEDFPGATAGERCLFFNKAVVDKRVRFKIHDINMASDVRVRPLEVL
jgi:hypothetical protein